MRYLNYEFLCRKLTPSPHGAVDRLNGHGPLRDIFNLDSLNEICLKLPWLAVPNFKPLATREPKICESFTVTSKTPFALPLFKQIASSPDEIVQPVICT